MNGFNLTEDQAITAITVGMDFGVTQVHTLIRIQPLSHSQIPTYADTMHKMHTMK